MYRNRQNSWGTWTQRMTRRWVSGVFFFPHILQSRSCRNRQPRNADRHKQKEKTKNPAFSKQDKQGRQPREIHLDNSCFTQGAHHRKNKGFILICTSKGRVENRAPTRWPPSTLWDGVSEGGRRWGPSPAPGDNGAILPWRVEGRGSSKHALLPLSAKGVWVEVSWKPDFHLRPGVMRNSLLMCWTLSGEPDF